MKRIDLHLHTQKCKEGESDSRIIQPSELVEVLSRSGIGVCAITNHNKFDWDEFKVIREMKPDFIIFPGIELDIEFNEGEVKHIIIICDPVYAERFCDVFSKDSNRNYDTYKIKYLELLDNVRLFRKDEIVIIPHFLDKEKSRALNIDEKNKLKSDLKEYVVILETSKLQTMGIINAHNELSLIGSDVMDWKNYEEEARLLPEMKFSIDSFGKFYQLASEPKVFIKTALNGCNKHMVEIDSSYNPIELYEDINIIFGEKGSGKTILLKNYIFPKMEQSGKTVFFHEGACYQDAYNKMVENIYERTIIDSDLKSETINCISHILNYKEKAPENFIGKYYEFHIDETKNKKAQTIKKSVSSYNKGVEESISNLTQKFTNQARDIEKVEKLNKEERNEESSNKQSLASELKMFKSELLDVMIEHCEREYIHKSTNLVIKSIKESLEKKTGAKSKPNNIGLSSMVSQRRKLVVAYELCQKYFDSLKSENRTKLGELPNKGEIFVEVSINVLSEDIKYSKGSAFDKSKIRENRETIKKIFSFSSGSFDNINEYYLPEERDKDATIFFGDCVKRASRIVRNDGEPYEPSEGEKAILSISGILEDKSYDCYLFDEIERGLGNKYISEYLIPKVKNLRDTGKMVVISTHNANIAISTLPSQTIYCNYMGNKAAEIYYAGNMYDDELVSIKDNSNILNWEEKALKHLEGSREMFGIRRNIWNRRK